MAEGLAPAPTSALTATASPLLAAAISAVHPSLVAMFGFAPPLTRASTTSGLPLAAADISAVQPSLLTAFGLAPRASSARTVAASPALASTRILQWSLIRNGVFIRLRGHVLAAQRHKFCQRVEFYPRNLPFHHP